MNDDTPEPPAQPQPSVEPPARAEPPALFDGPDWRAASRGRHSRPTGEATDRPTDQLDDHRVRTRVRRKRRGTRTLRRRRLLGYALLALGGLLVLGGVWIAVTGLLARSQLDAAKADVSTLRQQVTSGDFAAARRTAADLRRHADRAHSLTTGPAWATAADLPGGGAFETVRTLATQIDTLADDVLPPLVQVSEQIDPSSLRRADGSINLAPIVAAAPVLDTATARLATATAAVTGTPSDTGIGPVDRARTQLLTQLGKLTRTLRSADSAAHLAPQLLGNDGVKRYLVSFENDAEMRGTGGLPGAFAIIRADHGKVTFERFEPDNTLLGTQVPDLKLDSSFLDPDSSYSATIAQEFYDAFGRGPMKDYRNSNLSPNFPFAAQIWIAMWKKYSGQTLNGAATLDPTALSYLLRVTGPATLPGGQQVSAGNVVALTQQTLYARFPNTPAGYAERKKANLAVAEAASRQVLKGGGSTTALVRAGAKAAGERRLLFYSTDTAVETQLVHTRLGGAIPIDGRPYAGLSIVNLAGNKLDYYLHRTLAWSATGCGTTRTVKVKITLTNDTPTGLPAYVTNIGSKLLPKGAKPGDNRLLVSYYASPGATLVSDTVNGLPDRPYYQHLLMAHPLYVFDLFLPRGATRVITLTFTEPTGTQPLDVLRQPGVVPLAVSVRQPACSADRG